MLTQNFGPISFGKQAITTLTAKTTSTICVIRSRLLRSDSLSLLPAVHSQPHIRVQEKLPGLQEHSADRA